MVMGVNTCTFVGFPLIPFKGLPLLIFGTLASVLETFGYTVNYAVYLTMAASGTSPLFLAHNAVKEDNELVWGTGSSLIGVFIVISWTVHTCLAYIL